MTKTISQFQSLIFSILMRHKDEILKNIEHTISHECSLINVKDLIKSTLTETKMHEINQKMQIFIDNEVNQLVSQYFKKNIINLKIERFIVNEVDKKIKQSLKDNKLLKSIQLKKPEKNKFVIKKARAK